jgi:eukaryotic-like serine/threonine-protein kinase
MSTSLIERSTPLPAPPLPRLGRYEALAKLASGGNGTVYLARLLGIGGFERLFAIKVLHKHLAEQPAVVEMLLKEARITSQIQHPHVVDTLEVGATDDGEHYLAMAYVEGVSLDDLLEHPTLDAIGRLRLGLPILLDAMSGLEAAHRATDATTGEPLGVVHRDVSPANILIGMDGIGRVADFGIASARVHSSISEPELLRGTPRYMAPEQTQGGQVDRRADVFALGAVLWEIITGEPLFDSRVSVEHILSQVVSATIPPPSDRNSRIPTLLDAVCLRALRRDVAERYETVASFRDALAQVADAEGLIATPGELIDELARLFGERIEQRRALVRRVTGRKSGSRLRAVTETQLGITPLRDAAADSVARALSPRSPVTATQIGIRPPRPVAEVDPAAALEAFLERDDEDELPSEPTEVLGPYRLPRKHWRRWAVLVAVLAALVVWRLAASSSRAPAPVASAPVAVPRMAAPPPVITAPSIEPEAAPIAPAEAVPVARRAVRAWKPLPAPVRPRPPAAQPEPRPETAAAADTLPLEPNPYLLQR